MLARGLKDLHSYSYRHLTVRQRRVIHSLLPTAKSPCLGGNFSSNAVWQCSLTHRRTVPRPAFKSSWIGSRIVGVFTEINLWPPQQLTASKGPYSTELQLTAGLTELKLLYSWQETFEVDSSPMCRDVHVSLTPRTCLLSRSLLSASFLLQNVTVKV